MAVLLKHKGAITRLALTTLAIAALPLAATAQSAAPPAMGLLRSMAQAERNAAYSGTEVIKRGELTVTARVWKDGLNQRLEYTAPPSAQGDLMVDDGTHIWRLSRAEARVTQADSRAERFQPVWSSI